MTVLDWFIYYSVLLLGGLSMLLIMYYIGVYIAMV